jgi:hypothetical protein
MASRRLWLELSAVGAGAQNRLAPGDLDDERIGASRRRADIAAFFNGGLMAPYRRTAAGGDVFVPTGETLRQIQDRVLPVGQTINGVPIANDQSRVPLLDRTRGWLTLDFRAGYSLTERVNLNFGVMNLLDRNFRIHASGVDMPGVNAFLGVHWRF